MKTDFSYWGKQTVTVRRRQVWQVGKSRGDCKNEEEESKRSDYVRLGHNKNKNIIRSRVMRIHAERQILCQTGAKKKDGKTEEKEVCLSQKQSRENGGWE